MQHVADNRLEATVDWLDIKMVFDISNVSGILSLLFYIDTWKAWDTGYIDTAGSIWPVRRQTVTPIL